MKALDPIYPIGPGCEERCSKVLRAFLLAKPTPRNDTDTSCVEQAQGVEFVWLLAELLRAGDGFAREVDGWEEVHCSLVQK